MRDGLRGFLSIGVLLTLASVVSALLQPRDSAEFVVSVCSTGIGLTLFLSALVMWRLTQGSP
jgi:hypothetical protein